MKTRLLAVVALTVGIVGGSMVQAAEPYLEFVQGLRDRGYHDFAILYLDQIAAKANTPAEIKQVIPYQKAMTLQESAKTSRSPEKQLELLNQAEAFLEDFVKANPNHPSAADANSDRATILLSKGQAEVLQSKSPSNQGAKRDFQNRARETIAKARAVFQTAFDQHDANYKKFPAFIDQQKDPDQYAARAKVEQNLITASLSLGMCSYEEAQSHDRGSNEFKQLLNKAADEFEKMHQKYRSQVGGLYARAWQGKCYEEQNDLQKAMGIYNELLAHPGENTALAQLKAQTLYFKLICLNSKERNDHQLAVDLSEEWLKAHPSEASTRLGLSIQWERALGYEALGDNRELLKTEQERLWKQARTGAMQIQKFPGEFKDVATSMAQRLQVKLGDKLKAPNDFETANGLARQAFSTAQDIKQEIDDGIKVKRPAEEIAKLRLDWSNELNEAARYFELALALVKPTDAKKEVAQARLFFAYANYWLHRNYEAAVLAQFVARTADKDDGTMGLDAAYIAMAAFVQAYNENKVPVDQKADDMRLIVKASNLIAQRWPSSDKANEANMMLGRMVSAQKKPAEAAVHFGKVPATDPKYPEAQLAAGQAYWTAYLGSSRITGPEKPTTEQLAGWLKSAEEHLVNGIRKMAETLPKGGAAPGELIAAKMSLTQITITQGKDAEAIKLLLDDPQSVIKAVTVADETARPETGVTSRKFATETYKLLLRAYIGTGNLEKARDSMKTLEKIAAAGGVDGGAEITELYVSLGRLLKEELDRLRANGETARFDKLMTSFETFLNDMASRKEGQTFGTLSWIGETYFALGETVSGDAAKSTGFYEKAGNAFTEILNRGKEDQTFAAPMQMYGVKLRQISVLRLKKEFETAETLMTEVLKDNSNNLKVQIAAAELYQDWGSSGQTDSTKKLAVAINGTTKSGGMAWGWGQIGSRLQKSADFGTNPAYTENFLIARYNGTLCRHLYGTAQSVKEKQKILQGCRTELVSTSAVTKDMSEEWYQKFNALYRQVQADLGEPATDLPRAVDVPVAAAEKPEAPQPIASSAAEKAPEVVAPPSIDWMTWMMFIGCLVLGVGAVGWVLLKGKGKPKHKEFGAPVTVGAPSFAGMNIAESLPPATFVAPKPKPRPATAGGAPTGAKPARPASKPSTGTTGAAAPKPKPKPPSPPASP